MNITEILEARGFVVEPIRDDYLSVRWADPAVDNVKQCVDFMNGRPSVETEELLALLEENGWRLALEYFVPIEWGFVITTRDS